MPSRFEPSAAPNAQSLVKVGFIPESLAANPTPHNNMISLRSLSAITGRPHAIGPTGPLHEETPMIRPLRAAVCAGILSLGLGLVAAPAPAATTAGSGSKSIGSLSPGDYNLRLEVGAFRVVSATCGGQTDTDTYRPFTINADSKVTCSFVLDAKTATTEVAGKPVKVSTKTKGKATSTVYDDPYTATFVNKGLTTSPIVVHDLLNTGAGVAIVATPTITSATLGFTPNPSWQGLTGASEMGTLAASPGLTTIVRYTVRVEVPNGLDPTIVDCVLQPGETGTGSRNLLVVQVPRPPSTTAIDAIFTTACAPLRSK